MAYNKKHNPRPDTDLEEQYTFLMWQKMEAQEDIRAYKYLIAIKEDIILTFDRQLKDTYLLIEERKKLQQASTE